ncbi:hypothetical protein ACLQ91_10365 [Avibacterium endocarditidis]|uniref:hypothetical protein n=1 Tax=Avibacterium endocarditidis TaxID=380674 RepID=UPI0039FCA04F
MYIEYSDIELETFFESSPISIFDNEFDGNVFYKKEYGDFILSFFIYTYLLDVNVFLDHKNNEIISLIIKDVISIRAENKILEIVSKTGNTRIIFDKGFKVYHKS